MPECLLIVQALAQCTKSTVDDWHKSQYAVVLYSVYPHLYCIPSVVLHTLSCTAYPQLYCIPSVVLHTLSCTAYPQLYCIPSVVLHTLSCTAYPQLYCIPSVAPASAYPSSRVDGGRDSDTTGSMAVSGATPFPCGSYALSQGFSQAWAIPL